ncbi:hypothetical protein DVH05_010379 [Phytophthora capsici]|nr:hypothetical protein DVH05_010379 [Phytophthora capsici]|eukprot:jgi/Phyca11/540342/estExt2_Genewise1Plus.C_PHYCAscaffold_40832
MFDPRICSPDSPVDSAMFPPVYNRSTSSSSTASMSSCPGDAPSTAPLPSIGNNNDVVKDFKQEVTSSSIKQDATAASFLEPFEFRPTNPTPRAQNGTSLSSVFGDQDLIDAIMCSLTTEQQNSNTNAAVANIAIPAFSPAFVMPRRVIQQVQVPHPTSFTALMQQRPISVPMPDGRVKSTMAGPCLRKPGTFLNKDGRWIKGKPCRMEGCDKRAQSNGLCKGHGGGARCSFAGCSKSSQGGGFCRAHGGGKRCMHEGCEKGTQRNGFCYLHGGVRSCSVEGCDKKDRGNGKCFSHGGGRKCQAHMCFNTIRRGAFCDLHNGKIAK